MAKIAGDLALSGFGIDAVRFSALPANQGARVWRTIIGNDDSVDVQCIDVSMATDVNVPANSFMALQTVITLWRTSQTIGADDCPLFVAPTQPGTVEIYPAGIELLWASDYSVRLDNPTAVGAVVLAAAQQSRQSWRFPPGTFVAGTNQRLFVCVNHPMDVNLLFAITANVKFAVWGTNYARSSRRGAQTFASLPRFDVSRPDRDLLP